MVQNQGDIVAWPLQSLDLSDREKTDYFTFNPALNAFPAPGITFLAVISRMITGSDNGRATIFEWPDTAFIAAIEIPAFISAIKRRVIKQAGGAEDCLSVVRISGHHNTSPNTYYYVCINRHNSPTNL